MCANTSLVSDGARCHIPALPAWGKTPGCLTPNVLWRALGQSAQAEQGSLIFLVLTDRLDEQEDSNHLFFLHIFVDFRLNGIKGVKAGGSAPVSKEHGKSQPLRALCFSRSRYRLNRLFLLYVANVVLLLVVLRFVFVTQATAEATLSATYLPSWSWPCFGLVLCPKPAFCGW